MASSSTPAQYPSHGAIVLPSIQEMFPEHLMPRTRPVATPHSLLRRSHHVPQPALPQASFCFDVLQYDPRGYSLQHIASSRVDPPPVRTQSQPWPIVGAHSSSDLSDGDAEMEGEDGEDGDGASAVKGRKHVCPRCGKRFNRPSSLHIHRNTHTGATPFHCPYPSCGRAFNVNSNMRRHFRNHTSPAFKLGGNRNSHLTGSSRIPPISPISPEAIDASAAHGRVSTPIDFRDACYCESDVRSQR